ncbi:RDD family protein [Glycomyces sp. NPDC048151]|uniref:RDD family protein n=1 Tax=Glycomyces sp. NPDC048151 TaxID=3364002 RepID=UPI0037156004
MATDRVKAFGNGTRYVEAGGWARFFAWLIDAVIVLFGLLVGTGALAAADNALQIGGGAIAVGMLVLLFAVPLLYGLCYTNGRALGALATGTRLVRVRDGGRIGAKGPWAMVVRTVLLPLLIIAVFVGGTVDGSFVRTSIDVARTRGLPAGSGVDGLPARTP